MTLLALTLTAAAGSGSILATYNRLMASGCDLSQVQVWSTIEARILRNTPYAMRGHVFKWLCVGVSRAPCGVRADALLDGNGGWGNGSHMYDVL